MFKRLIWFVFILGCVLSVLNATESESKLSIDSESNKNQGSCVIFNISIPELENYSLINATTNKPIPLSDPSRQFMRPGEYRLRYENFGYKIYNEVFKLGTNQELVISHQPVSVSPQLLESLSRKKRSTHRNLYISLGLIAVTGAAKYLGDDTYDDYQTETDPSRITSLREKCEIYEISFLSSAGLSGSFLGLSAYSFIRSIVAKKAIRNAMGK
jgi:hypothetical protein